MLRESFQLLFLIEFLLLKMFSLRKTGFFLKRDFWFEIYSKMSRCSKYRLLVPFSPENGLRYGFLKLNVLRKTLDSLKNLKSCWLWSSLALEVKSPPSSIAYVKIRLSTCALVVCVQHSYIRDRERERERDREMWGCGTTMCHLDEKNRNLMIKIISTMIQKININSFVTTMTKMYNL